MIAMFSRFDRNADPGEDSRVKAQSDKHLSQIDRLIASPDADEADLSLALASAVNAQARALPARSARYGARVQALRSAMTRKTLGSMPRFFDTAKEANGFVDKLRNPGARLVQIPFLFSSTEYVKLVQATAGAASTSTTSGETNAVNYLDIDVIGFLLWMTYASDTAGATLPYVYGSLDSVKIEGGKSAIFGEQQMIGRPHIADCGYRSMFVPVARGPRLMEADRTAECSVTLGANGTTHEISVMAGCTLIGTAFER